MTVYLTFDIGTTALKTALVGEDGAVLAIAEEEYSPHTPQPGRMEMEPERYWEAAVAGSRRVVARAGIDPGRVAAIGLSSQAQSFLALDASGRPLTPVIVWLDGRARELAERWATDWLSAQRYRAISGYPWVPHELTLFKIAWLAENRPQMHARAAWFLCLPDYLVLRLTGEVATDYNIAQMSGMLDLRAGRWHQELLQAARISEDQLPTVHGPGTPVGEVTAVAAGEPGIPAGTPVCVGCNDQLAGAIGAGNVRPGVVTETTGTALAVVATTAELLDDERLFVGRHAVEGASYAMPFAPVSAAVLTWFRDLCGEAGGWDEFLAGVEDVPPGSDGLTVVPHFSGTASPTFNPDARGAMVGLTLAHGRAHIARAIMESCACVLRELLEPVTDHGIDLRTVCSLGGAARSDTWLQMKADMLGVPVERPACPEAASLGAAMLAATGTGVFESLQDAADTWYRPSATFQPDPKRAAACAEIHERYLDAYHRLYGREE
ncbi:MAG: FGGY family carbohydrate kinase [Armatimonadota bacterium]|nr:FGGY family carbohydrate kinase [Armatimonadota bacterium]